MTEELKTVLTIISVLVIGGIFGHGLWSIRKNKEELRDLKPQPRNEPGLDVKSMDTKTHDGKNSPQEPELGEVSANIEGLDSHGVGQPRTVAGSNTTEPEPIFEEPVTHAPEVKQVEPAAQEKAEPQQPSEVLIIHVSMPENQTISGASLLPLLISMGLKFGDMDIFHRHEDSAGNGPVLFSLASMYNPGTFDIDNIEQISTKGLSLFMTLPGPGEALQNFNMMHNAAKKVAEQFGGQILDSHRSAMTVQTVRHYVEKIREFERQQLING
jgi:cell division protein ZipA